MREESTDIIPKSQTFAKVEALHEPNLKAICVFTAIGFFLDQDTYWKDEIVLRPGTDYVLDDDGMVLKSETRFKWFHEPRNISFKKAADEFTDLYEHIVKQQSEASSVLLPISGGLDSRTQAAALKEIGADVYSYSYSFTNGFKEHTIAKKIALVCGFEFDSFLIPEGYLWHVIDDMASINHCYSDFVHPRQMAVIHHLKAMSGQFSLGHWGDVLFDRGFATADDHRSELDIIYKKLIKKGGLELASKLWKSWGLEGDFETYLKQRLQDLLNKIEISHKGAKIRAFKSLHWAPRWTSVSLSFFESAHPVNLPYYHDDMCRFICGIPEDYLADRKIQIEYIKNRNPKLANIDWQNHMPFNLYTYKNKNVVKKTTYQIKNKLSRELGGLLGQNYIQRNWELQFLGKANAAQLESYLNREGFKEFIDEKLLKDIYNKFKNEDAVFYSHAVSMLLTLAVWYDKEKEKINSNRIYLK